MKELPIALKTPERILIAVGLIVLVGEFLIMMLIESIHTATLKVGFLENVDWKFVDPIMLAAFVAPALYFLIFRALNQQAELERQLDELRRFQNVTVGRELRIKELVEEIAALRKPLSTKPAADIPVTSSSLEPPRNAAEQSTAIHPTEGSQRSALLFMLEDLKDTRKKIEQAHQEWITALDVVNDPIFLHDKEFRILRCNKAYQQRAGMPFKQIIGKPYYEIFPKTGVSLPCCLRVMEKAEAAANEEEMIFGDATYRSRTFSVYSKQGVYIHSVHILEDITKHKQAEAAIEHANRALATLGAVNSTLVHATNVDELLQAICQAIVDQRGYRLAWVGYVQHDERKLIKIMAHAGQDEGYLDAMQLTWADTEYGMGSSGRAIRSGATQLCQDIANDPLFLPWRDAALKHGYAANIALPLTDEDNTVFGILNVYAKEANAFTPNEIVLLEEMAGDLAFGVRSMRMRQQRDNALAQSQRQLVQLRDSLEDTVRAMAAIVEMRDPYTAGHQVRVANLAAAIAKQMALPEEQIHAIHLAGVVHDLGKINVPAEILSKPGKLTDIEIGLIKVHSQAGYDILKGIDFPWPIAQMVLQHHERLDGSGYPQGLKGEAILLGARILAVADATEAICSHRPYRPGLGVDVALAEITKQRGAHYDPQVVDACLTLFREQHYSFKS